MGGGSSQPTQTTTTTAKMSPEQQELYKLALPGVKEFAATVPERYPGQVAGFDPAQTAGQNIALASAIPQQMLANTALGSSTALQSPEFAASNPWLDQAISASVRPITEAYQQDILPGIRDQFQGAGQGFGGSRRAIADARATSDYMRNVGDTASKLGLGAYNTNIDAMVKALGLTPQTQQAQVAPGLTVSGVGDVRQNMAQQQLNEFISGFNYEQLAPFLQSQDIISLISGIPGGTTTSLSTGNVAQANPFSKILGGAATGASLGSAIMPGIGTGVGAGIGGLLAFL